MDISTNDCKGCKHKERCSGGEWFSYGEIFYCRKQMIFLIEHLVELGEGNWPANPDGSSYIDPSLRSKSFRNEAYFCKPAGLVACIMGRLDKTGEDGITLMEDIHSGIREYRDLKSVAKRALNYISGYRKRKEGYRSFKSRTKPTNVSFSNKRR